MAMGVEDEPHRSSWNNKSLLKVIRIISSDPSVFFFLISLTLLLMCCPLLALYITTAKDVPDFDTVKGWNTYLRRFSHKEFCVSGEYSNISLHYQTHLSISLKLLVHKSLTSKYLIEFLVEDKEISILNKDALLLVYVNSTSVDHCIGDWCVLSGCAVISVPLPLTNIHTLRFCSVESFHWPRLDHRKLQYSNRSCSAVVKIRDNDIKMHDVIVAYLHLDDKKEASSKLLKTTFVFAVLLLAFVIVASCNKGHLT